MPGDDCSAGRWKRSSPLVHSVDFPARPFHTSSVKFLLPLLCLLAFVASPCSAQTKEKEKKKAFVVYAEFVTDAQVDLSDGSKWAMDKGDCFPVHMFKDSQTKVILQLADATFMTPVYNVRILKPYEEKRAAESYRKMLDTYLKTQAENFKKEPKK